MIKSLMRSRISLLALMFDVGAIAEVVLEHIDH